MIILGYYFAHPFWLIGLAIVPILIVSHYLFLKKSGEKIVFPDSGEIARGVRTWRSSLSDIPFYIRLIAIALFIIALARPQDVLSGEDVYTEGIDIALVLDLSGSMLAEDFHPNRLAAAKDLIKQFVESRKNDRMGLVIFSREAFTQCPLTIDHIVLKNLLNEVRNGMIEDGTAIGNAIANGVNRLKDSQSKSKVMILLTDGNNNAGEVDPLTAAEIAKQFGIRVYTIGVGSYGEAPYPVQTPIGIRYQNMKVEIDENILTNIANSTGGTYFRANTNSKLESIFKEIDKLEKTRIQVTSYVNKSDRYYPWAIAGIIALLFEFLLSRTIFRKLP